MSEIVVITVAFPVIKSVDVDNNDVSKITVKITLKRSFSGMDLNISVSF